MTEAPDPHDEALAHLDALVGLLSMMAVPEVGRGSMALSLPYERAHQAVRESIEYHRRAMAAGFGTLAVEANS